MTLLAEEGSLLIARDACDWNSVDSLNLYLSLDLAAGADFGHHRSRNLKKVEKVCIPSAIVDVEEHCPGAVADICRVDFSVGQLPD